MTNEAHSHGATEQPTQTKSFASDGATEQPTQTKSFASDGATEQPTQTKSFALIGMAPANDVPSYDAVPWYRRQWVALFPLFLPALVVIALTGDVYAKSTKTMRDFSEAPVWRYGRVARAYFVATAILVGIMVAS